MKIEAPVTIPIVGIHKGSARVFNLKKKIEFIAAQGFKHSHAQFKNSENLQCQKIKCQIFLLSQKLTSVDIRHFKSRAFRVLSMFS